MIIKYTNHEFTLEVIDDRGESILAMRAENVEFQIDITKAAINVQKLNELIKTLLKSA